MLFVLLKRTTWESSLPMFRRRRSGRPVAELEKGRSESSEVLILRRGDGAEIVNIYC
jgi:hypothetical protein